MTNHHRPDQIVGTMAGMYKLAGASKFLREGGADAIQCLLETGRAVRTGSKLFMDRAATQADGDRLSNLYQQADERNHFDSSASLDFDRAFLTSRNAVDRAADWLQRYVPRSQHGD